MKYKLIAMDFDGTLLTPDKQITSYTKEVLQDCKIHKGINKSVILEELGKELNIKSKEMIFFGDGPNDLEVMQSVSYSVAMGNALEEVKAVADSVALSNNEDGVALFLKQFLEEQRNMY